MQLVGQLLMQFNRYRAIKELSNDFEFGLYGNQTDSEGNSVGNIYTGTIPHPVLSSANLCLYLHANYPIKDGRSLTLRFYDDYGKTIVITLIGALITAVIGLLFT